MKEAESQFSKIFLNISNRWKVIYTLRRVAFAGLPYAKEIVTDQDNLFLLSLINDPKKADMFMDKGKLLSSEMIDELSKFMTKMTISNFEATIDAASLIFAHSILDDTSYGFCCVTALEAPNDWEPFLEKKKISLISIKNSSYDDLYRKELDKYLENLEKESLIKKVEKLFQICRPPSEFDTMKMKGYGFDKSRLVKLDLMRHDIVHGNSPITTLPNGDDDLRFLEDTAVYLGLLVNYRYDLKIDSNAIVEVFSQNHSIEKEGKDT